MSRTRHRSRTPSRPIPGPTPGPTPLLHNMSAPSRTTVVCEQHTVHGPLVVFSLISFLQRETLEVSAKLRRRLLSKGILGLREDELRSVFEPLLPSLALRDLADGTLRAAVLRGHGVVVSLCAEREVEAEGVRSDLPSHDRSPMTCANVWSSSTASWPATVS